VASKNKKELAYTVKDRREREGEGGDLIIGENW